MYELPGEGTVVPKYVAMIKYYTTVYLVLHLVGLAKDSNLIKIHRVHNDKITTDCFFFVGLNELESTSFHVPSIHHCQWTFNNPIN
jgi:hypothetical protein